MSSDLSKKISMIISSRPELKGDLWSFWKKYGREEDGSFDRDELCDWTNMKNDDMLRRQVSGGLRDNWYFLSPTFGRFESSFHRAISSLESSDSIWLSESSPRAFVAFDRTDYGQRIGLSGICRDDPSLWKRLLTVIIRLLREDGWWIEASPGVKEHFDSIDLNRIESPDKISRLLDDSVSVKWLGRGTYIRSHQKIGSVEKTVFGHPPLPEGSSSSD